ncbi:MAG: SDR family NAD(P)-dependent oxidoreductase [candidate division Zixibacteria bacterium]|nr:SDR family NAD(P)-dependent oxidoreductase [candidate division Zixibacteria bacterium]
MPIDGKYAVVTGAGKGIGREIAKALMDNGAKVFGFSRTLSDLKSLKDEYAGKFEYAVGDVTDSSFLESIKNKFENIDVLINNAGFGIFKPVQDMTVDEFRSVLDTNLTGLFAVTKLAIPPMINKKSGIIINISSLAGQNTFEKAGAYCASKHGLNGLTDCMMLDLRKFDIKVITISPGTVITDFSSKDGWTEERKNTYPQASDIGQIVVDALNMPERCNISKYEVRATNPQKA